MKDFLSSSEDPAQWRRAAEYLTSRLDTLPLPAEIQKNIQDMIYHWGTSRVLYTLSQADAKTLIDLAAAKILEWRTIFNSKACLGALEDVQQIYQAALDRNIKLNLEEGLDWSSHAIQFCPGLKTSGNPEAVEQLFLWGVNPMAGNGSYFSRAVEENCIDIGKTFARFGMPAVIIANYMEKAQNNNNIPLYKKYRDIFWEYGRFIVSDSETLVENKTLDTNKDNRLKVIFNFSACRVTEVYEWKDAARQSVVRDFTFDEYGVNAVEAARQKLVELGGRPSETSAQLVGKKALGASMLKK